MTSTLRHTGAMVTADKLIGLMAEPARRRVIAALILASGDMDDLAERTGLGRRDLVDVLERLRPAELIEEGADGTIVLLEELFKVAARTGAKRRDVAKGDGPLDDAERVLAASIVDGRLVHLPRKRTKRLVVLDYLAQAFEPGVRYPEREVNRTLRAFDNDVATLRRYLVDERFLDRADGAYWRCGGTIDDR